MRDPNAIDSTNGDKGKPPKTLERESIGFLVVTRRCGEGIQIGENVHVMVNRIKNGQVRLAIYAPKSVRIQRSSMAGRKRGR